MTTNIANVNKGNRSNPVIANNERLPKRERDRVSERRERGHKMREQRLEEKAEKCLGFSQGRLITPYMFECFFARAG